MSSCDGFTPFQQSGISHAISRRFSPAKWNSVCPWKDKVFRKGVKKKFFHPCHLKKHKLLVAVLLPGGLALYFFSTPTILWRAGRDPDLVKNHQKTFFRVSTLEFPDGTVIHGIGFDSHYGLLLPLSGTIMLLDSDGTKHRLKGGHLCGPNGLRMLMHLYRKMQETKNLPMAPPLLP